MGITVGKFEKAVATYAPTINGTLNGIVEGLGTGMTVSVTAAILSGTSFGEGASLILGLGISPLISVAYGASFILEGTAISQMNKNIIEASNNSQVKQSNDWINKVNGTANRFLAARTINRALILGSIGALFGLVISSGGALSPILISAGIAAVIGGGMGYITGKIMTDTYKKATLENYQPTIDLSKLWFLNYAKYGLEALSRTVTSIYSLLVNPFYSVFLGAMALHSLVNMRMVKLAQENFN